MTNEELSSVVAAATSDPPSAPAIYRLKIHGFRGIEELLWLPSTGVNVILGGGDVGKTTILDAVSLLLSPTYSATVSDTDYFKRKVAEGFEVEAIMSLPPQSGIDYQLKPSWPWEWTGSEAVVPSVDGDAPAGPAVYCLRVRGTEDLDLVHEIMQPDGTTDSFPVPLRRSIGLVSLGGDDRNNRDSRLVKGSALDRLLSDKSLRSRMASELAKSKVRDQLLPDKAEALAALDEAFKGQSLPHGLDLAIIGGQGASIASMVGLVADLDGVQLPLVTWGAGTRRLSALAIAEQNQGQAPVTVVDEVERGLEPYRQRAWVDRLQSSVSQVFATTHSPFVIAAASSAALWYLDSSGRIGPLESAKVSGVRASDPGAFLARLAVIAEGATEVGFVSALLERSLGSSLDDLGVHVCDGGGHEASLNVLEALVESGLSIAGFVDHENLHPTRWEKVASTLGTRLFRWRHGCIEQNFVEATPEDRLKDLLVDPEGEKTGSRLRTLALRLGIDDKAFESVEAKAGSELRAVMIGAATGAVPEDKTDEKKVYQKHGQDWFKTVAGGRELEAKLFSLGLRASMKGELLPFCNAVRRALGLSEIQDLQP